MNMIVCIKQIIDPEAMSAGFRIDEDSNRAVPPAKGATVISPFDENAVEAALKIKDAHGGKITAISLGTNLRRDVVKMPLSAGADELILLEDEAFAGGDNWSTAHALAMAIKKIGNYDLIFCGRQSADWDAGQVGPVIAEILGLPSVTLAQKVDIIDGKARIERITDDGYEVIEASMPVLITVSNEIGGLRYPTIRGIMATKEIVPVIWKPADIGLEAYQVGAAGRHTRLVKLFQPVHDGNCEFTDGESPEEAGVNLALKLKEAKLL